MNKIKKYIAIALMVLTLGFTATNGYSQSMEQLEDCSNAQNDLADWTDFGIMLLQNGIPLENIYWSILDDYSGRVFFYCGQAGGHLVAGASQNDYSMRYYERFI